MAIFCLSLMGKNFIDFIFEAKRILKQNGLLLICEITSRIVSDKKFEEIFTKVGFKLRSKKNIKNYFTLYIFRLQRKELNKLEPEIEAFDILKPCLYKRR